MPTAKQMAEWELEYRKKEKEFHERYYKERLKDLEAKGIKPFDESKIPPERCDSPYTMEDSTATFLWIVVMVIGSIFKGNWIIWIIATIVWRKFVTRYK